MSAGVVKPVVVELALGAEQVGAVAEVMLEQMKAKGLVMVRPEREEPYTCAEAVTALNVSLGTVYNLIKAVRLVVIKGLSVKMIAAHSLHAFREGRG